MEVCTRRVLVLDDDPAVARTITLVAEAEGFEVHCFESAEGLLAAWPALAPSHIVLDLWMPHIDGIEVLHRLGAAGCGASIVLASGGGPHALAVAREVAATHGLRVAGNLAKPFRAQRLRELLRGT